MSMEDILATQEQLIDALDKLHINFKKDGAERKTPDYIRRRLETLEQYFVDFHNNHMILLSFNDHSHEYFAFNRYDQIKKKYNNIKTALQNYKSLENPELQPPTFQTPSISNEYQEKPPNNISNINKTEELMKKQTTNFKAFLRTVSNINLDLISEKWEFEDILKSLQIRWSVIDTLHWELENELSGTNAEYEEQFTNYEKHYYKLKTDINKKMYSLSHIEKSTPKVELPTFEGNYMQWVSFKDLFTETIHNNPSLSNAQKLQFLKSKVKGEPEKMIQHLQISSDNYLISWNILSHRYDNKRLIFTSHLNNLLNIPNLQYQSYQHIKQIHDITYESINAIENLGINVSSWDPFLVCILSQKLDTETYNDYMQSLKSPREIPVLKDFLQYLETKFMTLETSRKKHESYTKRAFHQPSNQHKHLRNYNNQSSFSKNYNNKFKQSYNNPNSTNQAISQRMYSSNITNEKRKQCPLCNSSEHRLYSCPTLLQMHPYERRKTVENMKLCLNCLHSHEGMKCFSRILCKQCNKHHNTLLHECFTSQNMTPEASRSRFHVPRSKPLRPQQENMNTLVSTPDQDLNTNSSEDIKQFEEIKRKIDLLKLSEPLGTKLSYHDIHHYFIIYVLIGILVVVAKITYWRQLRRRRTSAEPAGEAATSVAVPARPHPTPVTKDTECGLGEVTAWLEDSLLSLNCAKTNYLCFSKTSALEPIYKALGESLLFYCLTAWGGAAKSHFIEIERAQRALLKVAIKESFRYPTALLYERTMNFSRSSFPPLLKPDGSLAHSAKDKANVFALLFASNSRLDPTNAIPPSLTHCGSIMPQIAIKQKDVLKILRNLDITKASGPDGIPAIVLKTCAPELSPILTRLFRLSLKLGVVPKA
ncbi:uncharacterized protein LOC123695185 [Colias croceus]|uniref:uncharacterized protein LOC123695185 n=1 Tax=Colias crocea TaxID=72248 RepID=UPI001E280627|nr:uncharacterized protein LOC123695185 [Colias croceus]